MRIETGPLHTDRPQTDPRPDINFEKPKHDLLIFEELDDQFSKYFSGSDVNFLV